MAMRKCRNPKSRKGEFLMIGYLYKVYRNITKVRIVPNLNHNPNPMCVPKKCVYLSIISILNIRAY